MHSLLDGFGHRGWRDPARMCILHERCADSAQGRPQFIEIASGDIAVMQSSI